GSAVPGRDDRSWGHDVDADVAVPEFHGPTPREGTQRRLAGGIDAERRHALAGSHRTVDDDRATGRHERESLLHREQGPLHVDAEGPIDMRFSNGAERQEFPRAGVGEQDVQPPIALLDCADEHVEMLQIGDIAANARCVVPDLLDRRSEFRLAAASHDNRSALECQTLRRRKANAGAAACNESNLAFVLRGVNLHGVSAAPRFDSTPSWANMIVPAA